MIGIILKYLMCMLMVLALIVAMIALVCLLLEWWA